MSESSGLVPSDADELHSETSSKFNSDDVDQLITTNEQLKIENENLKGQLSRALELTNELESLHVKNRNLNSQLLEANQRATNFQNRLQIAQQKNQECEAKMREMEDKFRTAWGDKDMALSRAQEFERKTQEMNRKIESLTDQNETISKELQRTYEIISMLSKRDVKSSSDAADALKRFGDESRGKSPEPVQNEQRSEGVSEADMRRVIEKVCKKNQKLKATLAAMRRGHESQIAKEKSSTSQQLCELKTVQRECESHVQELEARIKDMAMEKEKIAQMNKELLVRLDQLKCDREGDMERYKEAMEAKEKRILELKEILASPLRSTEEETETLMRELSLRKRECEDMKARLSESQDSVESLQKKLASAMRKVEELKRARKQLKKHYYSFQESQSELKSQIVTLTKEKDAVEGKLDEVSKDNESLKSQLKAALASHTEGESAWLAKCQELKQVQANVDSLEDFIDRQRKEIESLNQQKTQMVELLHKQNQLAVALESETAKQTGIAKEKAAKVKQLEKENKQLLEKNKAHEQGESVLTMFNDDVIPKLPESHRFATAQIVHDPKINVSQRVRKLFDYVISVCTNASTNASITTQELEQLRSSLASETEKRERSLVVMRNLYNAFANLYKEQKGMPQGCEDKELMEFLGAQSLKLDAALKETDAASPQYMTMDFLFNGSLEDRRQAIQRMAENGWDNSTTFDMFCAQALTNLAQAREIETLKKRIGDQSQQLDMVHESLGCSDSPDAHEYVELFTSRVKKLKSKNRRLRQYKEYMEELERKHRTVPELEQQIDELNQTIETLQGNLKALVSDATTLQRELDVKTQQVISLEQAHARLADDSSELQKKHLEEVCQFEKIIDERNRDVRDLTLKLNQLKADTEQQIESLQQTNQSLRHQMKEKVEKLKQKVALLQQRKKNAEQQFINKMKARDRQTQEEMKRYSEAQNDLKAKLSESTDSMNRQLAEQKELTDRLTASLEASEKRNQKIQSEMTKLSIAKKSLEAQIKSINEQMQREVQIQNSQAQLRQMNAETRYQEELDRVKTSFANEKSELMTSVLADFDQLDQFDEDGVTEDTFKATMKQIAQTFRSLTA